MSGFPLPTWKQIIQQLSPEEKEMLLRLVEERLQTLAEEKTKHLENKKLFEEEKQRQMEEDHQKLQALYNKLKTL